MRGSAPPVGCHHPVIPTDCGGSMAGLEGRCLGPLTLSSTSSSTPNWGELIRLPPLGPSPLGPSPPRALLLALSRDDSSDYYYYYR